MAERMSAKVLPTLDVGDSSPEILYQAVGQALTFWESLQDGIVILFVVLCDTNDRWTISRAFGYNMVVLTKLDMLEQALKSAAIRAEVKEKALSLIATISKFNHRRNDIAHGQVTNIESNNQFGWKLRGYYLMPGMGTQKKYAHGNRDGTQEAYPKPEYCWTAAQVAFYTNAFDSLNGELFELIDELKKEIKRRNAAVKKHHA